MKKIKFVGPYSWQATGGLPSVIKSSEARSTYGIYLWTVKVSDGMLISYVGETGRGEAPSFSKRFGKHLSDQRSGKYKIYDTNLLKRGKREWIWPGASDDGAIKCSKQRKKQFDERYDELSPHLEELISTYKFYIAPFKGPQRLRLRIEAAIAEYLKAQRGRIGGFHEPGVRYHLRQGHESQIKIHISSDDKLIGVPKELFV